MIAETVLGLVGKTPLVRIREKLVNYDVEILAKLEMCNPGGSVKDRIALNMINQAEKEGALELGGTILEPTSGNTGIGLAMVAAVRGYRLILTMPASMSEERRNLLQAYGVELILTPANQGMNGAIAKVIALKQENPHYFVPQQFANAHNPDIHRCTTALEILEDVEGRIDAFVAGVGTGGTITGVGEVLKQHNPQTKVVAVEPAQSAVLSGEKAGPHRIQGIGAGFIPSVLQREVIDQAIRIDDHEAYVMSTKLAKHEGLLVGISSGAAMLGALEIAAQLPAGSRIVTVFPDTGQRYLSMAPYFKL